MIIIHKPFHAYIVCYTLYTGVFITVTCKKLLSDTFSYTIYYINYISKLASPDYEAGNFKGELHNESAISDFIGCGKLKCKHEFLP